MAFKPLHDRVLVRRIEGEEKTKGGLIIPDTAKEKPAEGEIVSVRRRRPQGFGRADRTVGQGRRPHPVRQMVGHRSDAGRRRTADHEGKRHPRHHRLPFRRA
jgi:hypothetical protein